MRFATVRFSVLLLVCFVAGIATAQSPDYAITDLGLGVATGINSSGQVVGCTGTYTWFLDDYNNWATGGWLYSGGTRTDLSGAVAAGPGGQILTASGINNSGQITGTYLNLPSQPAPLNTTSTYIINTDGTAYELGCTFPSGQNTQGINSLGQVCGYVTVNPAFSSVGHIEFIYTPTFGPDGFGGTELYGVTEQGYFDPMDDGEQEATARGINDNGQVVGQLNGRAIMFDSNINWIYDLGNDFDNTGYNFSNSEARAINNSGQMCGWAMQSDGAYHAFLLTPGAASTTVDLGLVHGGDTCANAINNSGEVVGESFASIGTFTDSHAFVYNGSTSADLNSLIAANSGWTLTTALGINDSGDIVGGGIFDGQMHGFLLTPEAPPQNPGDANGDGRVDINDLTIVLANYGQTGMAWSQGCMDGDPTGAVDINDLTIVLANYGTTYGTGLAAVPEPSTIALLLAPAACLIALTRRKRK
jgi:probable HAF family extracellular repeat protein